MIRRIDALLTDWAIWWERALSQSAIGYPGATVEARLREDGCGYSGMPPGSIVPDVLMPPALRAVDHAVRALPDHLREVLLSHYVVRDRRRDRRRYHHLDQLHHWLEGRLSGQVLGDTRSCAP